MEAILPSLLSFATQGLSALAPAAASSMILGPGGWATTVTPAAGGASSILTLLQGGMSGASALASMRAGLAGANEAEMQARQEYITGSARAVALREDALRRIGAQQVAFAAAGVDPMQGTAANVQRDTARRAGQDAQMELLNAGIRQQQLMLRAGAKREAGYFQAFGTLGQFGLSTLRRGGPNAEYAA